MGADEDADAAAGIGEDADDSKIAVENPLSFATIRTRMGRYLEMESALFESIPSNWSREVQDTGRRHKQTVFVRAAGAVKRSQISSCRTRGELEDLLEKEHPKPTNKKGRGKKGPEMPPYLGHVVGGRWEIRRNSVGAALQYVLKKLEEDGNIAIVRGDQYLLCNKYCLGTPFMKKEQKPVEEVKEKERKVKKQKIEEPEPEQSEYEKDRKANIAANAAFLASLGL